MPRIPTYTAQLSRGNINPVEGNPSSAAAPYNALAQVGESVAQTAQVFGMVAEKRKQQKDITAADERYRPLRHKLDEFLVANQNSPTIAEDFKQFGESLTEESASDLPSQEAQKMFRSKSLDAVDSRYGMALRQGESNRLEAFTSEISQSSMDSATSYRTLYSIDPELANHQVRPDLDSLLVQIDKGFGGIAPGTAEALRNEAMLNVITGVMEVSPKTALELIDEYPLDERQRKSLRAEAQSKIQVRSASQVQQLDQNVRNILASAGERQEVAMQPPLESYVAVYGSDDVGQAQYDADRPKFQAHNQAVFNISGLRGRNTSFITDQLDYLSENTKTEADREALDITKRFAAKLIETQAKDPASYLEQLNPVVSDLKYQYNTAIDDFDRRQLRRSLADATLRYQGNPPPDAKDADYYLSLPSHMHKAMTNDLAESYAAELNGGTPTAKVDALLAFEASFDMTEAKDIAWRQMVNLPAGRGISQEMQALALNINDPWARQLAASFSAAKENAANKGYDLTTMERDLASDEIWGQFVAAYSGDNSQNVDTVAGFRKATVAFAASLDGDVNKAFDQIIGKKFAFEEIGDQTFPFPLWFKGDGRVVDKDEFKATYLPRIKGLFSEVDASKIKTDSPDGDPLFPKMPPGASFENEAKYIAWLLRKDKMLMPSADGKGAYLYMRNELGIPTQLFTKDGRPWFMGFNEGDRRENWPTRSKVPTRSETIKESNRARTFVPYRFDIQNR